MAISSVRCPTSVTFVSKGQERPYHDHCPLCIDSMVHPADDNRKPAIIFLGMNGVMIDDTSWGPLRDEIRSTIDMLFPEVERHTEYQWAVAKGLHLDPHALKNLHDLIERIEQAGRHALVVLSSGWRNDATLEQHREEIFGPYEFSERLCGKIAPTKNEVRWTPECKQGFEFAKGAKESFGLTLESRSDVIEFWLRDHSFDPESANFIVIEEDDTDKRERFGQRFIQADSLFKKEHFDQATEVLKV